MPFSARFFRHILPLLAVLPLLPASHALANDPLKWAVYYEDELPAQAFYDYDLLAFDSDEHPTLRPLQNKGSIVLGYISLAEAETYRNYFEEIRQLGIVMDESPDWPGHHYIDVRDPKWAEFLVEKLIPRILHKGFNGIMLDTTDSAIWLEEKDPVKYKGMREGAVYTIRKIRQHYPDMAIMVNRGFGILTQISKEVDFILAESILVKHLPNEKTYELFPDEVYDYYVGELREAKAIAEDLEVVSVDYWPPEDTEGVRAIYARQRASGFHPYVSTIELNKLFPEPIK